MAKYLDETGLSKAFELIKNWATATFLGDVTYDPTSRKIQKTKNGTTSDVVTIPSGVSPYDSNPTMDGTADPGSSGLFARGDHVHPTDTSRAANTDFAGATGSAAGTHGLVPAPASGETTKLLWSDGNWKAIEPDLTANGGNLYLKLYKRNSGTGGEGRTQVSSDDIPLSYLWPSVASASAAGLMSSSDFGKLSRIADGAEVNVQSDWNQTNTSADDYIKNKPTIPTVPGDFTGATSSAAGAHGLVPAPGSGEQKSLLWGNGTWDEIAMSFGRNASDGLYLNWYGAGDLTNRISWTKVPDATTSLPGAMSASDKTKLDSIATGAEVNVQSNWTQTTTTADDYIKNKPALGTAAAKTVGAASGNLQENGAALSASKAVVTDANKKFVSSSYTLGAACEKSIGSVADGDTGLVTGDAVYDAIQDALSDVAGALVYKGTAANASAISGTSYKKGWYWIASATFALTSSINVEPGDMIIAKQDKTSTFANDIDVVQTNIDTLTEAEVTALWNAA